MLGNTFLDVKKCKAQGKMEDFILWDWKLQAQRSKEGILKIASPKVQGRHIWENYTLAMHLFYCWKVKHTDPSDGTWENYSCSGM